MATYVNVTLIDDNRAYYFLGPHVVTASASTAIDLETLTPGDISVLITGIEVFVISSDMTIPEIQQIIGDAQGFIIVADIPERDALTPNEGDAVMVLDIGDTTWAKYQYFQGAWVITESEGGGVVSLNLDDLIDVDVPTPLAGQVLKYNDTTGKYEASEDLTGTSLTAADIKILYESNANTNEFSDVVQSKLAGIEANARADQSAAEVSSSPVGSLSSINVQAALQELDAEKSSTSHTHAGTYAETVHNHDTQYYTQAQVDTTLTGYSVTSHDHDTRYYTQAQIDSVLGGKADLSHSHSIANITGLAGELLGKSDTSHDHLGVYEPANANIQSHIISGINPHGVTAIQVGSTVAQWNADQVQGIDIHTVAPLANQILQYNNIDTRLEFVDPPSGAGGETNTASNIGTAGIGVYSSKLGTDLRFRNINTSSSAINVALDSPNNEIDISLNFGAIAGTVSEGDHAHAGYAVTTHNHDADYSAITHNHDGAYATTAHTHALNDTSDVVVPAPTDGQVLTWNNALTHWEAQSVAAGSISWGLITGTLSNQTDLQNALDLKSDTSHTHIQIDTHIADLTTHFIQSAISITESQISDLGSYEPANANIQTHIADTLNPHTVTAAQVGNTSAQWNANQLQGRDIVSTLPTDGQVVTWNNALTQWEPQDASGGGAAIINDLTDVNTTPVDGDVLTYNNALSEWQAAAPSGGGGGLSTEFRFELPPGANIAARVLAATNLPSGWVFTTADIAGRQSEFGLVADTLVIEHTLGKIAVNFNLFEYTTGQPVFTGANGFAQLPLYDSQGEIKTSEDQNAICMFNFDTKCDPSKAMYFYIALA